MKNRIFASLLAAVLVLTLALPLTTLAVGGAAAPTSPPANTPPSASGRTNSPPVAENFEFSTFRGVSFGEKLMAVDPDGDIVTFEITTEPRKGSLRLSDDGSFVYTPVAGKKGRDYFGYRAVDVYGAKSQEATVIIKIEKQKTKIAYSDMVGNRGEYAAVTLAESDIFIGAQLGGQYMFEPERGVTRGEFLAMCMRLVDARLLTGVQKTGFADDAAIPAWVKPYVSTALLNGYISGYSATSGGAVFDSEAPITASEAAVILNRILNVSDVTSISAAALETAGTPVWASQAMANLGACGIMSGVQSMSAPLSRGDTANLLLNADRLLQNRAKSR